MRNHVEQFVNLRRAQQQVLAETISAVLKVRDQLLRLKIVRITQLQSVRRLQKSLLLRSQVVHHVSFPRVMDSVVKSLQVVTQF
jgi:hypothetical protein